MCARELLEILRGTSHAALIVDILDAVHRGAPALQTPLPAEGLSPSELRVLRYLALGLGLLEVRKIPLRHFGD